MLRHYWLFPDLLCVELQFCSEGMVREQAFPLLHFQMFYPLNVTVVLSSLELWTEENKISTAGEADDLLQRFLEWKQSYPTLQSYDMAYLLV